MTEQPDIAIIMSCPLWQEVLPGVEDLCMHIATAALYGGLASSPWIDRVGQLGKVELSVVLADDATVRNLNRDYRSQDCATNVLAFATLDDDDNDSDDETATIELGDVVIAYETTLAEALDLGITLADHLGHLVVHGVLHTLGYDHEGEASAVVMERLETAILADLGIDDPYADDETEYLA